MQPQLQHPTRKRAIRTLLNKRFRAGYDFLLLRNETGETELESLCVWWTDIQTKNKSEQESMCDSLGKGPKKSGRRNKRRSPKAGRQKTTHSTRNVNKAAARSASSE